MKYSKLKEKLFKYKLIIDTEDSYKLRERELDKEVINNDLIQYFIFFEELEKKIDIRKNSELKKYSKTLSIINQYLNVLEKKLK